MKRISGLARLAVLAAGLVLPGAPDALAQSTRLYPVKFICGRADGSVLAPGDYRTAINIMNPNQSPDSDAVQIRKKYSVALPGETVGGTTDFIDAPKLGPGEAYEIDCEDIFRRTREFCSSGFCKGFATIEGSAELEVVAVYSGSRPDPAGVDALHTERVTAAQRCPVESRTVNSQPLLFVPEHVRGDAEFNGHGPCVRFSLDLRTQDAGSTLLASYYMHAYECQDSFDSPKDDYTAAEGRRETILFSAGPGSRILGYNVANSMTESYIDTDDSDDFFSYGGTNPVQSLQFTGDTSGDEAGSKTGVQIVLREMQVKFENCGASAKQ
jgi:hypothetical protein